RSEVGLDSSRNKEEACKGGFRDGGSSPLERGGVDLGSRGGWVECSLAVRGLPSPHAASCEDPADRRSVSSTTGVTSPITVTPDSWQGQSSGGGWGRESIKVEGSSHGTGSAGGASACEED
ncbi:unnamed protein product, partial [Discosporangium mesarthrocarpum]